MRSGGQTRATTLTECRAKRGGHCLRRDRQCLRMLANGRHGHAIADAPPAKRILVGASALGATGMLEIRYPFVFYSALRISRVLRANRESSNAEYVQG